MKVFSVFSSLQVSFTFGLLLRTSCYGIPFRVPNVVPVGVPDLVPDLVPGVVPDSVPDFVPDVVPDVVPGVSLILSQVFSLILYLILSQVVSMECKDTSALLWCCLSTRHSVSCPVFDVDPVLVNRG